MQSNSLRIQQISSPSSSSVSSSPESDKNLSKVSHDDFKLNSELTIFSKKFNIGEIKESLLNSKNLAIRVDDPLLQDNDNVEMRKRSNTWPIKKIDLNASTNDFEKIFAAKMIDELGIESGKQLKNPWGNLSYSQLIEKAIECSPWKSLSLKEIYSWFTKYVPFFKDKSNYKSTMGWKVSVLLVFYVKTNLIFFFFLKRIQ